MLRFLGDSMNFRTLQTWVSFIPYFVISIYLLLPMNKMPINFDEAYNLQVPLSLLYKGKYRTIYNNNKFDGLVTISTGPTVLIPIYIVFKYFGVGILRARVINYFYILLILLMFWKLAIRYYHYVITITLSLLIFSTSNFVEFGLSVLGELPAMFFILAGILIWSKREGICRNLAIVLMGLSVLTKVYFVLIVFPLLFVTAIQSVKTRRSIKSIFPKVLIVAILFFFPLFLGEIVKLCYLGVQPYTKYLKELLLFATQQQRGVFILTQSVNNQGALLDVITRFITISQGIFPAMPPLINLLILFGYFWKAANIIKQKSRLSERDGLILICVSILFIYLIWFLFISELGWWRHFFPFAILYIFLLGDLLNDFKNLINKNLPIYHLLIIIWLAGMFYLGAYSSMRQYNHIRSISTGQSLEAQREFADRVKYYNNFGYKFYVDGWWQAPEISFLAGGIRFFPFSCITNYNDKSLVIYTKLEEELAPKQAKLFSSCLGNKLFTSKDGRYIVYKTK